MNKMPEYHNIVKNSHLEGCSTVNLIAAEYCGLPAKPEFLAAGCLRLTMKSRPFYNLEHCVPGGGKG
jgi:hypothetical protein